MAQQPSKKVIHVVLDTNCLFTGAEDQLLRKDLKDCIKEIKRKHEIEVLWHIPTTVLAERRFQMRGRIAPLLNYAQKIETIFNKKLDLNEGNITEGLNAFAMREMQKHHIAELDTDTSSLSWETLLQKALDRLPPFETDNEKGFRDYLILESFWQLAQTLPDNPNTCRFILITNDDRLIEAFKEKMADRTNAETVKNLDELKSHLNMLIDKLTQPIEEKIKAMLPKIALIFFDQTNVSNLYNVKEVGKKIAEKHRSILSQGPGPNWQVNSLKIFISPPTFITTIEDRIKLVTKIRYLAEATKTTSFPAYSGLAYYSTPLPQPIITMTTSGGSLLGPGGYGTTLTETSQGLLAGLLRAAPQTPLMIGSDEKQEGEHYFEVAWEITLTSEDTLKDPKIIEIKHTETKWNRPFGIDSFYFGLT